MISIEKKFLPLKKKDQQVLHDALHYMNMAELNDVCSELKIPHVGMKATIIARIMYFLETGKMLTKPIIPEISRAMKHRVVFVRILQKRLGNTALF